MVVEKVHLHGPRAPMSTTRMMKSTPNRRMKIKTMSRTIVRLECTEGKRHKQQVVRMRSCASLHKQCASTILFSTISWQSLLDACSSDTENLTLRQALSCFNVPERQTNNLKGILCQNIFLTFCAEMEQRVAFVESGRSVIWPQCY